MDSGSPNRPFLIYLYVQERWPESNFNQGILMSIFTCSHFTKTYTPFSYRKHTQQRKYWLHMNQEIRAQKGGRICYLRHKQKKNLVIAQ